MEREKSLRFLHGPATTPREVSLFVAILELSDVSAVGEGTAEGELDAVGAAGLGDAELGLGLLADLEGAGAAAEVDEYAGAAVGHGLGARQRAWEAEAERGHGAVAAAAEEPVLVGGIRVGRHVVGEAADQLDLLYTGGGHGGHDGLGGQLLVRHLDALAGRPLLLRVVPPCGVQQPVGPSEHLLGPRGGLRQCQDRFGGGGSGRSVSQQLLFKVRFHSWGICLRRTRCRRWDCLGWEL